MVSRNVTAICDGKPVSISMFELEQLISVVDSDNDETLQIDEMVELLEYIGIDAPRVSSVSSQ